MSNKILNKLVMNKENCDSQIVIKKYEELTILEKKPKKEVNYYLEEGSTLELNKFYNLNEINETINIYLDGRNSRVILNLSTISKGNQNFVINVFHNDENTISNINIHGVEKKGNINVINNGYIKKGSKNSILNQDNKIITIGEINSKIEPNLFIDEIDSEASHGAYVGKFNEDDLFYLKTRGLSEKESYSLLIKGFLIGNMNLNEKDYKLLESKIIGELEVR